VAIGLDGRDRGARVDQRQGQGAEARADLDHVVTGADVGQAGDAPDRVGVDDEVLAEGATGRQSVAVEEVAGLGRGEQELRCSRTGPSTSARG
jgi:hypothetical protein